MSYVAVEDESGLRTNLEYKYVGNKERQKSESSLVQIGRQRASGFSATSDIGPGVDFLQQRHDEVSCAQGLPMLL